MTPIAPAGGRPRVALWVGGILLAAAAVLASLPSARAAEGPAVLETTVADPITPVIADHLEDATQRAARDGYEALVVRLDTPGGLDTSMRDIVQAFLAAEVPVVVHVAPRGARAASAGAVITLAAHIAAMAPGTSIGAATPVDLEGGDAGEKTRQDAIAYARSLAETRGRSVTFAVEMVDEARSASAAEALELGVIDVVAATEEELLRAIDGRSVVLASGRQVVLDTAGAAIDELDMTWPRRVLQWLADPNIAVLLLSIGTLGIIYELASPGIGAAGVIGVAMLVLAMFSLSVLPIDAVGFVFLGLAAAAFAAELFAPGVGVFAVAGSVLLVLGALFLFRDSPPGLGLSLAAVVPSAVVLGGGAVVAGRLVLRARARGSVLDTSRLSGREVVVERTDGTRAQGRLEGAWWSLRRDTGPLEVGQRVRVVRVAGLDLIVEPDEGAEVPRRDEPDQPGGELGHE